MGDGWDGEGINGGGWDGEDIIGGWCEEGEVNNKGGGCAGVGDTNRRGGGGCTGVCDMKDGGTETSQSSD